MRHELGTDALILRAAACSAVNRHTGWDLRPREVEVVEDPNHPDLVAIQVNGPDGKRHFLYDRSIGMSSMQEREFTRWPPFKPRVTE